MANLRVTHVYEGSRGWRKVHPFSLTNEVRDELVNARCSMVRVKHGLFRTRTISLIRGRWR